MFTRVVEITTKTGKAKDLCGTIQEKVLPILKSQPGFVDEVVLVSETEPDQILALSFWKSRADAERYHREQFTRITDLIRPVTDREPVVRTFNLESSTVHKIAAGKAA